MQAASDKGPDAGGHDHGHQEVADDQATDGRHDRAAP
jgi:hypothetical protein